MHQTISKFVLENGLTVLVYPNATIPKVAVQLWYNVGSKDEKDGERGLAHLLEHMIFKGTNILSESDINLITHKLSGSCNAFTSYDYTAYIFDFPKQNWLTALPLLANCMNKCTFKEDLLNTELKAVIQELKMYKDDYTTSLCEEMIGAMFKGHPYHFPIIGFKQDLWSITRQGLLDFYHRHYIPNNATLVIAGDVRIDDTIKNVQHAFGGIQPDWSYKKHHFHHHKDIKNQTIMMRRDVQQPALMLAWTAPGLKESANHIADIAGWVLGEGRGSRLHKKLINEYELATDLQVDIYDLFDQSVFFIHVDPVDEQAIAPIEKIVIEEIDNIKKDGLAAHEIVRAQKQAALEYLGIFENNQKIAHEIGKLYLATGDENELFAPIQQQENATAVQDFFKNNLLVGTKYTGMILPFANDEQRAYWLSLQEQSDLEDQKILSRKVRESVVECGSYVQEVTVKECAGFNYPRARKDMLPNGIVVLSHCMPGIKKISVIVDCSVRSFFDPEDKQGLINFMFQMLLEGTQKYTEEEFADFTESRGIGIDVQPGIISLTMLKDEFETGLDLLNQMLTKASFNKKNIQKVRQLIGADIEQLWDEPLDFVGQIARTAVYKDHPYHKNPLGSLESIKKITETDLKAAYKKYLTPHAVRLAVVGDIEGVDVVKTINEALGSWRNAPLEPLTFPALKPVVPKTVTHQIQRDQTVLCYAGISLEKTNPNYSALLLFEQIFSGGVLGSMSSQLFQLREQTGLFYTIGGSLTVNADQQPGMIFIRTIVSNDCLHQAETLIEKAIQQAAQKMNDTDLEHAKNAIVNSLVDNFESSYGAAQCFLFVDQYNLPADYFDTRIAVLQKISLGAVQKAVEEILDNKKLVKIRIGRV
jgi:zinc protease